VTDNIELVYAGRIDRIVGVELVSKPDAMSNVSKQKQNIYTVEDP